MTDAIAITIAVGQGLMDIIMALVGFVVIGFRSDLRELTAGLRTLNDKVLAGYVTEEEFRIYRERQHDILDKISGQLANVQLTLLKKSDT